MKKKKFNIIKLDDLKKEKPKIINEPNEIKVLYLKDIIDMKKKENKLSAKDITWLQFGIVGRWNGRIVKFGDYTGIKDCWKGQPCFVIGGSIGLKNQIDKGFKFEYLKGYRVIVVNHVLGDYMDADWLFFQDKRFIDLDKNWKNFKGRSFAGMSSQLEPAKNITVVYRNDIAPTLKLEDGLFSFLASGIAAANLALISGANPIYLFGVDNGGIKKDDKPTHYKKDYIGARLNMPNWQKYLNRVPNAFDKFKPWANKIYNVDKLGDVKTFKQIDWTDIKELQKYRSPVEIIPKKEIIITHIGLLDFERMGDITRNLIMKMKGKHIYKKLDDNIENTDIIILHCFKNNNERFINFKKPSNSKIISLIHSSYPCMPAKCSDEIVTLTKYWQDKLLKENKIKSKMIYGAIETINRIDNYNNKIFGRITRNAPGKFHDKWNNMINTILDKIKDSLCIMIVDNKDNLMQHERCVYDTSIKINESDRKKELLKQLSLAIFAHGDFEEIFPMAVLECMSVGLPIISLSQPSMNELIGDKQIICETIEEMENEILKLLVDSDRKSKLGTLAYNRAKEFNIGRMITEWDILIQSLV